MYASTAGIALAGFVLAPLFTGIINKTKAVAAGRTGAPVLQPYFDTVKLMRKGTVYSVTAGWVFRLAPSVILASTCAALLIVPAAGFDAVLGFSGDIFLFAGLLTLGRLAMILAAMDTGSAFEGMGASREAMIAVIAEPALLLTGVGLAVATGHLSLSGMLGEGPGSFWTNGAGPAVALLVAVLFLLLLAENSRIPVDDPTTHLELTMVHEVMILDHSGPDLAYLSYAAAVKLWAFAALLVSIVLPVFHVPSWAGVALFGAGMLIVAVLVGMVESSMARLRMVQVPQLLTVAVTLAAMSVVVALGVR